MTDQQYETDQRIRAAVRDRFKSLHPANHRPHPSIVTDDVLDVLEPLTLKTEDGHLVKVKPYFTIDDRSLAYWIVEDPTP
jgi:hypothetical protein